MKKIFQKLKQNNERGARQNLMEELFYDFNRSRFEVYKINFLRGLFFGLGSVIGGTIVVGLLVWILGAFGNILPPLSDFLNTLIHTMQSRGR